MKQKEDECLRKVKAFVSRTRDETMSVPFLILRSPDIPDEVVHLITHHILLDTLRSIGDTIGWLL